MNTSNPANPANPTNPTTNPITVLMGLRGSGKSTLGQLIAKKRNMKFVDLDDATVALMGCADVAQAWERFGEARFREAETRALAGALAGELAGGPVGELVGELAGEPKSACAAGVLALGGGTPTVPGAQTILREAIKRHTVELVYLRGSPATLISHLTGTDANTRPSLTGAPMLDEIAVVHAARDDLYRSLATRVIEIDSLSIEQILGAFA